MRTYSELITLPTFEERFNYLKLDGRVGDSTFGFDRYLNQKLYSSPEWKRARREVMIRDNGRDLGAEDHEIFGKIFIHHMNPISLEDIEQHNPDIFNPEYLITVSYNTHNAIHYGSEDMLQKDLVERTPNDTSPWR